MAEAHATEHHDSNVYYVPHGSRWPVIASVALFVTMLGFASWLNDANWGKTVFFLGVAFLAGQTAFTGVGFAFLGLGIASIVRGRRER